MFLKQIIAWVFCLWSGFFISAKADKQLNFLLKLG